MQHQISDLLQDLVETNFKPYKRIAADHDFSAHLMHALFDQYRRQVKNGGLTEADILEEISEGETKHREFKSSLRYNVHTDKNDDRLTHAVLKTIAAFQNTEGGVLYIGVADDGDVLGIEHHGFPNDDKFLLHLNNVATSWMGQAAAARMDPRIWMVGDKAVCRVACRPSPKPVYVTFQGEEAFFVRTGMSTVEMTPSQMQDYVSERF